MSSLESTIDVSRLSDDSSWVSIHLESMEKFQFLLRREGVTEPPAWHVVLGSGFGVALEGHAGHSTSWKKIGGFSFEDIPGLFASTAPDHRGEFRIYQNRVTGQTVIFQMGRLHGYEGHTAGEAVVPVMLTRQAGTKNFLLTNAAGGLDPRFCVGDAMIIRDHVNFTGQNPLVGPNPMALDERPLGPRFPDLSTLYDVSSRARLAQCLREGGLQVHEGVYLGLLGPSFETPAEIRLFQQWGMHAVGMSTVWEAIALKHSGACVVGLSLISNAACGLGDGAPLNHERILEACRNSASRIVAGILEWLESAP